MAGPNFLDRFRPIGSAGPGTPVGVPASDSSGVEAELAPVFAALRGDVEACRQLVAAAEGDAEHDLARTREQATALVAQARLEEASERATGAAEVLAQASNRDAHVLEHAQQESAALERAGVKRLNAVARDIVQTLLDEQLLGP